MFPSLENTVQTNELIKKLSNLSFKQEIQELINIYRDNWEDLIRAELIAQFPGTTSQELAPLITRELNILKRYVQETATVYKKAATRTAYKTKEEKTEAGEVTIKTIPDAAFEKAIRNCQIDVVMREVNRMTKLTNHVILKVAWRNKKWDFDLLLFNNCEILTDDEDFKKLKAVKYYSGLSLPVMTDSTKPGRVESEMSFANYEYSYLWTLEDEEEDIIDLDHPENEPEKKTVKKSWVYKFKNTKNGGEVLEEKKENPYKDSDGNPILPFVKFDDSFLIDSAFDFTSGNDLRDLNINVALNLVHINELIKYQSYIQMYFMAQSAGDLPDKIKANPRTVWKISNPQGNSQVGTLDMQADIEALYRVIMARVEASLGQYGIGIESFKSSGTPESGFHLFLKNRRLVEIRESDLPNYRDKEKELFEVMRAVYNKNNPGEKIDITAEFAVDFAELEFPRSPEEEAKEWVYLFTYNVKTPIDWIMYKNPDLTRADAEKEYLKNKSFNAAGSELVIKKAAQPGAGAV
jgi:hypothetical protein